MIHLNVKRLVRALTLACIQGGALTLVVTPLPAQFPRPWEIVPGFGLGDALSTDEAHAVAFVDFERFDSGPAVLIYIRSGGELFRCFDYFDRDLRSTGAPCFRWVGNPERKAVEETQLKVYRLYRSSIVLRDARLHVATFDAETGDEYNRENCDVARDLFVGQPGVMVRYWCEQGL